MVYELVIIGSGLSGLRIALSANEIGMKNVLVVDYEKQKGGFHSSLFDKEEFHEEKELLRKSDGLSYEFWQNSTAIGLFEGLEGENHQISVQTPSEIIDIEAQAVVICTGSLEKPRESLLIAGSRPAGIMTPMMALSLLERNKLPGKEVVIFVNGKITRAISKMLHESGAIVKEISLKDYKLIEIKGNSRVTKVNIMNQLTHLPGCLVCDTVIFNDGNIPSTFFLKGSSLDLDSEHRINVDEHGKTNIKNIFAYGNCTNKPFDYFSDGASDLLKKAINI